MENNSIPYVVMIGSERKLYDQNSMAYKRLLQYAEGFDELDVIVFTLKHQQVPKKVEIGENIRIHATQSVHKLLYSFDAYRIGKRIIATQKKKSLVTVQDPFEAGIVGTFLSRGKNVDLHVQIHGDYLHKEFAKESFLNKIRVHIAHYVVPKAKCIRVVSKRIAKSIQERYRLRCNPVVLPIYTDIHNIARSTPSFDLHEKYPQFQFIALMSSRLERVKGIETAIYALQKALESNSEIGLIILGDGSLRGDLEKLAKKLKVDKSIIFEGWQDDVFSYLKGADVFLNTSFHEGYCLSLIEAAATRCPIITTDVGVVGESLNNGNLSICDIRDVSCFARKILSGMENKDILAHQAEHAYKSVVNASLQHDEFLEEYRNSFNSCYE